MALPSPASLSTPQLLDELALYLRPPGQGIHTVSSGKAEAETFTKNYLGSFSASDTGFWRRHLDQLQNLKGQKAVALLAIPSDCGAGIMRGASHGPEAIRKSLKQAPCLDLGDVFSVPHFIDDEMLSDAQKKRARASLYPDSKDRDCLPVSPVGMASRVYRLLRAVNPELKILLLGGDHTVTWPAVEAILEGGAEKNRDVAIVHFDAHTDLLPERLGVKYCFATWAYHANELLGRGGRLLQIGIRISGKPKQHWEKECGVRQIWANEANALSPDRLAESVVAHLNSIGVKRFYLSNDLDGTDAQWASATGTPEPGGLTPDHVLAVIHRLGSSGMKSLGADVVELAPGLSLSHEASRLSVETAVRYVRAELELLGK